MSETPPPSLIDRLPRGRALLGAAAVLALALGVWSWTRETGPAASPPTRAPAVAPPPGVAATLEGIARALPADATLAWLARNDDGRLAAEVITPDPDRLRAALRRDAATAGLRDAGQRRGDGGIVVTLEEASGVRQRVAPLRNVAPVRALATRGGLLIERADAAGIAVSGETRAVIAFVAAAEAAGAGLVRWRLERSGAATRLAGTLVAAPRGTAALTAAYARDIFAGGNPAADEAPADAPELAGVIGRIGRDAVALVRDGERTRTIAPGEGIAGWRLESLSADAAFFTRGTQRARVALPAGEPDQ